ncbi:MAG: hypothetical protein D3924_19170 [Candidatus Electrothrix sp. AR4]|nr:hypothetical protein [Candidatus Electrothrix sp. AR4]
MSIFSWFSTFTVSRFFVLLFCSLYFFAFSPETLPAQATADIAPPALLATVKGKSHAPKKYIRVEMTGPEYKKMATDDKGRINTQLAPGEYRVLIRERGRQMEFELTVYPNKVTRKNFILAW